MFRKSRKIFYLILYHQPQRALNPLISHRLPPYADTLSSDRHSPLFRRSSAKVLTIQHFGTKHLPKYRRYSQKDQFVCRPYAPLRSQAADDLKLIDQAYANSARICRYFLTISKIICAAFRIAHRNTADDIFITTEMSAFRQTFFSKGAEHLHFGRRYNYQATSSATWRQHKFMLFEARSQAIVDRCRFIIIKSPKNSYQKNKIGDISASDLVSIISLY